MKNKAGVEINSELTELASELYKSIDKLVDKLETTVVGSDEEKLNSVKLMNELVDALVDDFGIKVDFSKSREFSERLSKCFDNSELIDLTKIYGDSDITKDINKPGIVIYGHRSKSTSKDLKDFCDRYNIKYTPSKLNKEVKEI